MTTTDDLSRDDLIALIDERIACAEIRGDQVKLDLETLFIGVDEASRQAVEQANRTLAKDIGEQLRQLRARSVDLTLKGSNRVGDGEADGNAHLDQGLGQGDVGRVEAADSVGDGRSEFVDELQGDRTEVAPVEPTEIDIDDVTHGLAPSRSGEGSVGAAPASGPSSDAGDDTTGSQR